MKRDEILKNTVSDETVKDCASCSVFDADICRSCVAKSWVGCRYPLFREAKPQA